MKTLVLVLALFTTLGSSSQTLIRWDFENSLGNPTLLPTFVIDTTFSVNPVAYSQLYPLNGNPVLGVSGQTTDWAKSVRGWYPDSSANVYSDTWIEFRFFIDSGFVVKIDSVSLWCKRDSVGPKRFDFRSHKDLYGSQLSAILLDESDTLWGKWSVLLDSFVVNGFEQVTFRIYGDGAPSEYEGYFAIDSVAIFGQMVAQRDFSLKAYLSGPWNGMDMSDSLRSKGLIPLLDPYGFGKTVPSSVLSSTGPNAIVDWVVVGLRSGSDSTLVVSETPFLLQRDGDVVGLDGISNPSFLVPSEDYYVYIRHRNHLSVMTNFLASDTVDFTSPLTPVFGVNSRKISNGVAMLWEGDVTGNGAIKYVGLGNDRDEILQSVGGSNPNNVVTNVYTSKDVNLDGDIRYIGVGNDRDPILISVGSDTPNAVREEQVP